jgi:tetratricopeptide (TPR) repeat protein
MPASTYDSAPTGLLGAWRHDRLAALVVGLAMMAGCRIPGTDGPISRSLLTCRKLSQRGITALDRGDCETAEMLLSQAVDACPVDPEARRYYAESLWRRGQTAKAVEQLEKAVSLAGDNDELLVRAAELHLALNDSQAALRDARLAIDVNPRSAGAWALQGRVLRRSGQPRSALAALHRALSYSPDNRDVLLDLAETYRELGEPQRALVNLQNLIDTYSPGDEPQQALYLQGLALSALGRDAEALDSLAAARDRGPPTPDILVAIAQVELRTGDYEAARASVRAAVALDPAHAPSRSLLEKLEVAQQPARAPIAR